MIDFEVTFQADELLYGDYKKKICVTKETYWPF